MKKYELLLIDLDGTILDFYKSEVEALKNCFKAYGIESNKEIMDLYITINNAMWQALERGEMTQSELKAARFAKFLEALSINNIDADEMSEHFLTELGKGKYLIPGSIEFMQKVKQDHIVVYITNGITKVQRARLENNPIAKYADNVYISEETGYSKPNPHMIEMALSKYNIIKSKALIIGDSESSDIQAGINSGVDSLYVNFKNGNVSSKATYTAFSYSEAIDYIEN